MISHHVRGSILGWLVPKTRCSREPKLSPGLCGGSLFAACGAPGSQMVFGLWGALSISLGMLWVPWLIPVGPPQRNLIGHQWGSSGPCLLDSLKSPRWCRMRPVASLTWFPVRLWLRSLRVLSYHCMLSVYAAHAASSTVTCFHSQLISDLNDFLLVASGCSRKMLSCSWRDQR